jgi:hypothetical protein
MEKCKIITYDPAKGKKVLVGTLIDGCLLKRVSSKHFMKVEQGYGIQEDAIEKLKECRCITVLITTETKTYEIPFQRYLDARPKDYGNGLQRFVKIGKPLEEKQMELFA